MFLDLVFAAALTSSAQAQTAQSASPQALDDQQIVGVLQTLDQSEIEGAKAAQSKATDSKVKDLAKMIQTDHQKMEEKLTSEPLIKPSPSNFAETMQRDARTRMKNLETKKGKEFDRAYVQDQIAGHRLAIEAIDHQLMPQAKKDQVKTQLKEARKKIEAHLSHAESISKAQKN